MDLEKKVPCGKLYSHNGWSFFEDASQLGFHCVTISYCSTGTVLQLGHSAQHREYNNHNSHEMLQ